MNEVGALVEDAVNLAILPVRPKRSVESLVSTILGADLPTLAPVIVIDQITGNVLLIKDADGNNIQTALDAVANAGDRVQLHITDDSDSPDAPKLIFEGGAV
jgi:hypothetical protein